MDPLGNSFCGLVENDEEIGKYVLNTLTACISEEKWHKRLMEANPLRLKTIVKTLVLEWKWCKMVVEFCKSKPIMSAEKTTKDVAAMETAFSRAEALKLKEDGTGKKANLHPLVLECWDTCNKILNNQTHYNTFQSAEAMNKAFPHTANMDSLTELWVPTIKNPWTDAHTQFAGQGNPNAANQDENEEENKAGSATPFQLPTRTEAIKDAAKKELELYTGTSFVRSGDLTQDRAKIFLSELAKALTTQTAPYNSETQGNRRGTLYDEKGRREPKWAYVIGRNEFRSKVPFQKEDFEDFFDLWAAIAKPGEGPMKDKVDVFVVWNAEQEKANPVIMKKLRSLPGMEGQLKKTLLKGLQAHVERRLWEGAPDGAVGDLAGLPGMQEELFELFAGNLPTRRKHQFTMGGVLDNMYPEEIVPLRNPKSSEPVVTMEVKKMIFPPDDDKPHDGDKTIRGDEVRAPCHFQNTALLFW